MQAFAQLIIVLTNHGQVNTYWKEESGLVVDLAIASPSLARVISWNVSKQYTHSDYHAIVFNLKSKSSSWKSARPRRTSDSSKTD